MNRDGDHLRLLAIFHYIVAAIMGLFSLFPIIHVIMGVMIMQGKFPGDTQPSPGAMPPSWFGALFVAAGAFAIFVGLTMAVVTALAGRFLAEQRRHTFCLVVAAICCIFFPFGTVLGVFTILVLMRPSVKDLFEQPPGRVAA